VKDYTLQVKSEFDAIDARLIKANEPFTLLHDEYKSERAKVLAKERAEREAVLMAEQKEMDHEFALLLDKSYLADKMEAEKAQAEYEEGIRLAAVASAEEELTAREALKKHLAEKEAKDRLANKEHVRGVNRSILAALLSHGIDEGSARAMISLAAKGILPNLTIKY
jgi:hypothetical protein